MLTSPSGKIYIGQTIRSIKVRLDEHKTGKSNGCRAIYNAIQKYGWENIEKDWYECPDEELNKHEELMVEVLGTLSPDGYNLKEGGGSNGKMSEETKQKMSEIHLGEKNHMWGEHHNDESIQKMSEAKKGDKNPMHGKRHTDETIRKMIEANIGKTRSEETKLNIRESKQGEKNPMWGEHHSEETKQKMSEAKIGKTMSEETKQKLSESQLGEKNSNSKRVYQYDLEGTFIDSYGSCGEAGSHLEKASSCISRCARGQLKTAYRFKWSYDMNTFM